MQRTVFLIALAGLVLFWVPETVLAGPTPEAFRDCVGCHTAKGIGKVAHPVSCSTCHVEVHSADAVNPEGTAKPVPQLCFTCHDESSFAGKDHGGAMESFHSPVADGLCTYCHSPHTSDNARLLTAPIEELCQGCHGNFTGTTLHQPLTVGPCTACHNPHASKNPTLLNAPLPALCFECHEVSAFAGTSIHAPVIEGMCPTCHNPHASDNAKLLTFPESELCLNCHTLRDLSRRMPHQPAADGMCSTCHSPHGSSNIFQLVAPINELCLTCHPGVTETPHMVGGFNREGHILSGVPDPRRPGRQLSCTSCHNPHGSNSRVLLRFRQRSTLKICSNCHK